MDLLNILVIKEVLAGSEVSLTRDDPRGLEVGVISKHDSSAHNTLPNILAVLEEDN